MTTSKGVRTTVSFQKERHRKINSSKGKSFNKKLNSYIDNLEQENRELKEEKKKLKDTVVYLQGQLSKNGNGDMESSIDQVSQPKPLDFHIYPKSHVCS